MLVGNDSAEEFWGFGYGIKVFDLSVDQICSLLEKPDLDKGTVKLKLCLPLTWPGLPLSCMKVVASITTSSVNSTCRP